jgi:hypothetical protein
VKWGLLVATTFEHAGNSLDYPIRTRKSSRARFQPIRVRLSLYRSYNAEWEAFTMKPDADLNKAQYQTPFWL